MRASLYFMLAAVLVVPSSCNWFTDKMTSGYGYLKTALFGEDKFRLKNGDEVHKELSKKFAELKDDGVSLSYNLIYYNMALNLERECYFRADSVEDCEQFVTHIKNIITENVKTGSNGQYSYMLIEEFYNKIFDVTKIHKDIKGADRKLLEGILTRLSEFFNGPLFAKDKEELTFQYNAVLDKLMKYLYSEAGLQSSQRLLGLESSEEGRKLGLDDYLF